MQKCNYLVSGIYGTAYAVSATASGMPETAAVFTTAPFTMY